MTFGLQDLLPAAKTKNFKSQAHSRNSSVSQVFQQLDNFSAIGAANPFTDSVNDVSQLHNTSLAFEDITSKSSINADSVSAASSYFEVGMKNLTRQKVALEMKRKSSSRVDEANTIRIGSSDELKHIFENKRKVGNIKTLTQPDFCHKMTYSVSSRSLLSEASNQTQISCLLLELQNGKFTIGSKKLRQKSFKKTVSHEWSSSNQSIRVDIPDKRLDEKNGDHKMARNNLLNLIHRNSIVDDTTQEIEILSASQSIRLQTRSDSISLIS